MRPVISSLLRALLVVAAFVSAAPAQAQPSGYDVIVEAREALRRKDRDRLAVIRSAVMTVAPAERHPLAMWVDYWELTNRIADASADEIEAFYARWPATYVEDRLRNDWLLEAGRRRDWQSVARDAPRFRMNDDREVTCYALLAEHLGGRDVRQAARQAWLAQRDIDDGCTLLAQTLLDARHFDAADIWRKARLAVESFRPRAAQHAAALLDPSYGAAVGEIADNAARYMARKATAVARAQSELAAIGLARMAAADVDAAASLLERRWERALPADLAGWAWSQVAKQAALALSASANDWFVRAERRAGASADGWSDETRAWAARAALRANDGAGDWRQLLHSIAAMSETEQRDPAWSYWKALGLLRTAAAGAGGDAQRAHAQALLEALANPLHYYGQLAAEALGVPIALPPAPPPLTAVERAGAIRHAGLDRALLLVTLGLRNEGVREWNYSLRGMSERELLAAAEHACARQVWDRCINTSERTRGDIDIAQRFPLPFRAELVARSADAGLDPAYVYGLIRQESRFIVDIRSSAGASGLMQLMPGTARWTARRIGLPFSAGMVNDRDVNLRLGTAYLKLVLDDFDGSLPLAIAAYNAGPGRPRKWREGPRLDPAAWVENIPFGETRDYVKKVLGNATVYGLILGDKSSSLRARLGRPIGPREFGAPEPNQEIP